MQWRPFDEPTLAGVLAMTMQSQILIYDFPTILVRRLVMRELILYTIKYMYVNEAHDHEST